MKKIIYFFSLILLGLMRRHKKKRMPYIACSLVFIGTASTASAQVRIGFEGGQNISHAWDTDATKAGYNAGITIDYTFTNKLLLESALKLSQQSFGDSGYSGTYPTEGNATMDSFGKINEYPTYLILPMRAGYSIRLSEISELSLSAGPTFGCGLFSSGRYKSWQLPDRTMTENKKTGNIFDRNEGRNLSRFEAGGSFRISCTFLKHYSFSTEYNLMRVTGSQRPFTHMNVFAINAGYKF